MKLSASLPDDAVGFLDEYARSHGMSTRSSVLLKAVRLLRDSELGGDYAEAWNEWAKADEDEAWNITTGDGLSDES